MLGSITPLGERSRGQRWGITVMFFVAGSLTGGAAMGAGLGAAGSPIVKLADANVGTRLLLGLLATALAVGFVLDVGMFGRQLPTTLRQVSREWLTRYRGWVYGFGFGFQLGLGPVTIVTTSLTYLTLLACFFSGSWEAGLAIGAVFGFTRGAVNLSVARVREVHEYGVINTTLRKWEPHSQRLTTAAELGIGAVMLALIGDQA